MALAVPDQSPLLVPNDLRTHLRIQIPEAEALSAIRVASGQLRRATKLDVWPAPVPDDLWGWALELASLAYDNPTGRQSEEAGDTMASWPVRRRAEILAAAASAYSARVGPLFSFPPADPWPSG